jgi:hypothetical protein
MIIFLNGTINAGKSTVARLLKSKLPRPAVVEVDSLRAFIDWMDLDEAIPLNLENAASVIRNFALRGFNVIVPTPLSEQDYAFLSAKLAGLDAKIQAFTLSPSLTKLKTDTPLRKLSAWERQRMDHHHATGLVNPNFGVTIDNTRQRPEETAAEILKILAGREGGG